VLFLRKIDLLGLVELAVIFKVCCALQCAFQGA
jgi:hypothetical protein